MVSQLLIFVPSLSFDCLQGIKYTNVQISFHRYDRWRVYYTTKWLEYEVRSENHRTFWITQQRNVLVARGWQYYVYHIIIYCYLSTTCLCSWSLLQCAIYKRDDATGIELGLLLRHWDKRSIIKVEKSDDWFPSASVLPGSGMPRFFFF